MKQFLFYNSFIIIFYLIFLQPLRSQEVVKVLQPNTTIGIKQYQQVNDSICRYLLTTNRSGNASNESAHYIDYYFASGKFVDNKLIDSAGYSLLPDAYDLFQLKLADGLSIVASNGFECDILVSGLICIDKTGEVKWHKEYSDFFQNGLLTGLGLVSNNIFAVISGDSTIKYYDLEGIETDISPILPVYSDIVYVNQSYYGTNDNRIYRLDDDFNVVNSHSTDSLIFFQYLGDNLFLLETLNGIETLDESLNTFTTSNLFSGIQSGTLLNGEIWLINNNGLDHLSADLSPIEFFPPEDFETMKFISTFHDTVFVASEYQGTFHSDFVIRSYLGSQVHLPVQMDISIEQLAFPEMVHVDQLPQFPEDFYLRFDSMGIEIRNRGLQTLHSCTVNCDWGTDAYCVYFQRDWKIDSLNLLPGENEWIQLGSFSTELLTLGAGPEFCYWVDFPNELTDVAPDNDVGCGIANLVVGTENPNFGNGFKIYPNPARDHITLNEPTALDCKDIYFYDLSGKLALHQLMESTSQGISITSLHSGMYTVVLKGKHSTAYSTLIVLKD